MASPKTTKKATSTPATPKATSSLRRLRSVNTPMLQEEEDEEVEEEEEEEEEEVTEEEEIENVNTTTTVKSPMTTATQDQPTVSKSSKKNRLTVVTLPVRKVEQQELPDKVIISFSKKQDIELIFNAAALAHVSDNQEVVRVALAALVQMKQSEREGRVWIEVERDDVEGIQEYLDINA